jgi:uncharacterized protein YlxW (UPF0749 family)
VPRASRRQIIAGVLCAVVGFAAVTQVQSRRSGNALEGARQSDLVQILDGQTQLAQQLDDELTDLRSTLQQFRSTGDSARTALEQARQRAAVLGVLAGTLPASGPGITIFADSIGKPVEASVLLGAVQELRNAGAEAIQINDARIVASTYFTDGTDAVEIDGQQVRAPYLIQAIGDPEKLETAMGIPGGVIDAFARSGFEASVSQRTTIMIDALRPSEAPRYAAPTDQP